MSLQNKYTRIVAKIKLGQNKKDKTKRKESLGCSHSIHQIKANQIKKCLGKGIKVLKLA